MIQRQLQVERFAAAFCVYLTDFIAARRLVVEFHKDFTDFFCGRRVGYVVAVEADFRVLQTHRGVARYRGFRFAAPSAKSHSLRSGIRPFRSCGGYRLQKVGDYQPRLRGGVTVNKYLCNL